MNQFIAAATLFTIGAGALPVIASTGTVWAPDAVTGPAPLQSTIPAADPLKLALMCLARGDELSPDGKVCFYDCGGRTVAMTIGLGALCPLSIDN